MKPKSPSEINMEIPFAKNEEDVFANPKPQFQSHHRR